MFKGTGTNRFASCVKARPGIVLLAGHITRGIGRRAVIAIIGGMMDDQPHLSGSTRWCSNCEKYYNPNAPHECLVQSVNENRERLERWLGRFKVKEDS